MRLQSLSQSGQTAHPADSVHARLHPVKSLPVCDLSRLHNMLSVCTLSPVFPRVHSCSNFSRSFPSASFSIWLTYSPVKLGLKINQLLIKTSFPSKANPYFLIRSPATPRFSKSAWYRCSSICFSAASAVSSRDFSSPESLTLNSIMTA